MKNIVWLASYPKSGNTWMRVLLTNYLSGKPEPADINNLATDSISSSRHFLENYLDLNTSEMDLSMIDRYRPEIFRAFSNQTNDREAFIKAHEKYYYNKDAQPIFPTDATKAAVYIVRDPRDVALSYADHLGFSLEKTITFMNEPDTFQKTSQNRWHAQFEQPMGNWSEHVTSWTSQTAFPVVLIRYEDLLVDTISEFKKVIDGIGMVWNLSEGTKAVDFSRFEQLKEQEQTKGFNEKSRHSSAFFRTGGTGNWKGKLTPQQAAQLWNSHQEVMRKLGYSDQ
jgi:hypothetical protein